MAYLASKADTTTNAFMTERVIDFVKDNAMTCEDFKKKKLEKVTFFTTDTELDTLCDGIPRGHVTLISAGTGVGKSMFSTTLAASLAQKYKVLYFSLENTASEDQDRFLSCQYKKIPYLAYLNIEDLDIYYSDYVYQSIRAYIRDTAFDIVFIDGIQLFMPDASDGMESYNIGNRVLSELAYICKKYKKTVVLTWQLNRQSEEKTIYELNSGDVSGSIGAARYSGLVLMLGRPKEDKKDENSTRVHLKLVKKRNNASRKKLGAVIRVETYQGFYLKPLENIE